MSSMVDVHLHGPLAGKYGRDHRFLIRSPQEAVRALEANHPGFIADFAANGRYLIIADGDVRDGEDAATMPLSRDLHLCPQVEGGAFLGAALVGALFPAIAGTMTATIIGGVLFAGLMIGLSLLLAPKGKETKEDTPKDENFGFSGPENVTGQGAAVPLIYGRVYAGSVVISAGLELGVLAAPTSSGQGVAGSAPPIVVAPGTPTPAGGFPAIVSHGVVNGVTNWGPANWVNSLTTTTTVGNPPVQKLLRTWTPGSNPIPKSGGGSAYFYWNEIRGYFIGNDLSAARDAGETELAGYTPEEDEYTDA